MTRTAFFSTAWCGAAALAFYGSPLPASAQSGLPTLSDLGIRYSSPTGAVQLSLSGRADVEGYLPGEEPAWLMTADAPFVTPRIRLFTDLFVGRSWYASAELRLDGGEPQRPWHIEGRLEQLFLRWSPLRAFSVQAGKFVSPFGSYPSRHHTVADPLIRPPIMYEHRTMVSSLIFPPNSGTFVQWKRSPQEFRPVGAPPIWGAPYQWGVLVAGHLGPADVRVAALNSAPSSEPEEWRWDAERMRRPSYVVTLGYRFAPWLRAELYHNRGPYLARTAQGPLAGDATIWDYDQVLWGVETLVERGRTMLRAEAFHDRWQVPNVAEDPIDISFSVEARQRFPNGAFLAARYGAIEFNRIAYTGTEYMGEVIEPGVDRWDWPVSRLQLGGGYRITRNAEARIEYAFNRSRAPVDVHNNLLSLQLWWEF